VANKHQHLHYLKLGRRQRTRQCTQHRTLDYGWRETAHMPAGCAAAAAEARRAENGGSRPILWQDQADRERSDLSACNSYALNNINKRPSCR